MRDEQEPDGLSRGNPLREPGGYVKEILIYTALVVALLAPSCGFATFAALDSPSDESEAKVVFEIVSQTPRPDQQEVEPDVVVSCVFSKELASSTSQVLELSRIGPDGGEEQIDGQLGIGAADSKKPRSEVGQVGCGCVHRHRQHQQQQRCKREANDGDDSNNRHVVPH